MSHLFGTMVNAKNLVMERGTEAALRRGPICPDAGWERNMGPAEIVASLKELCAEQGPRLTTDQIVAWIEHIGGYESHAELVRYAKKMKARQFARMLEFEDPESGMRIKRLWSTYDAAKARRYYVDILDMPEEQRKRLVRQYARFLKQIRTIRKAMSDYLAGQRFFDFYPSGDAAEESSHSPEAGSHADSRRR